MADWTKAMSQTFEFYKVDPVTWRDMERLYNVEGCTISRDSEADTLGSATIDVGGIIDECYVRVYLVTSQNGVTERHPLATVLVQSPTTDFDGKTKKASMDAYTPLIELKEKQPPIGFYIPKDENIMKWVYKSTKDNLRAPVVSAECPKKLEDVFVAETEETWIKYLQTLMAKAEYTYALDELGRVLFAPHQDTASLQPVWTYDDSNSSILYPEITISRDIFDIPNVIEVVYSKDRGSVYARVVNDDPNSPVSTVNRGREILHRETNPKFGSGESDTPAIPSQEMLEEYARRLLKEMSTIEGTLSYTHGYCGTRLWDCVRLNYKAAGLTNVKAKIISQSIKCTPGCPVSEKAVFTAKLWG